MKKGIFLALFFVSLLFVCANIAEAIDLSLVMPQGTIGFKINKVQANPPFTGPGAGTNDSWTAFANPVTTMTFGNLVELLADGSNPLVPAGTPLDVFGAEDRGYFAIDIAVSGGGWPSGVGGVNVQYSGDASVGNKLSATYKQMTFVSGSNPSEAPIATELLNVFKSFNQTDFTGHWIRVYVGVITDPTPFPLPAKDHVFNYDDVAGPFSGSLSITVF